MLAGSNRAALRYAEKMVESTNGSDPGAWILLGNTLEAGGEGTRAGVAYRRALRLDPGNAAALVDLGDLASEKKDWKVAIGRYSAALRSLKVGRAFASHEDEYELAAIGLAKALIVDGRRRKAMRVLATALGEYPESWILADPPLSAHMPQTVRPRKHGRATNPK